MPRVNFDSALFYTNYTCSVCGSEITSVFPELDKAVLLSTLSCIFIKPKIFVEPSFGLTFVKARLLYSVINIL